jgi:hypothetical protein
VSWLKPLLGVTIAALPFFLFWFVTSRKRMPKAEDNDHSGGSSRYSGGGNT